jgi:hypothetical protein
MTMDQARREDPPYRGDLIIARKRKLPRASASSGKGAGQGASGLKAHEPFGQDLRYEGKRSTWIASFFLPRARNPEQARPA